VQKCQEIRNKMEKEFNLKKKYVQREPRKVNCFNCNKEYITKAKRGCCSEECKEERKRKKQKKYTQNHRELIAKSVKKYSQKNKKKINAKAKANYHVKIPKGQVCQFNECWKSATEKHI